MKGNLKKELEKDIKGDFKELEREIEELIDGNDNKGAAKKKLEEADVGELAGGNGPIVLPEI